LSLKTQKLGVVYKSTKERYPCRIDDDKVHVSASIAINIDHWMSNDNVKKILEEFDAYLTEKDCELASLAAKQLNLSNLLCFGKDFYNDLDNKISKESIVDCGLGVIAIAQDFFTDGNSVIGVRSGRYLKTICLMRPVMYRDWLRFLNDYSEAVAEDDRKIALFLKNTCYLYYQNRILTEFFENC
jgi:hypothetical protein